MSDILSTLRACREYCKILDGRRDSKDVDEAREREQFGELADILSQMKGGIFGGGQFDAPRKERK